MLDLLADSLGWERDAAFAEFFDWKHLAEPVRPVAGVGRASPATTIVGFRTFLRWEFEHPDGRIRHAVRAVDTATAPAYQGRGIFRRLTMTAVEELTAEGVDFVFNTPNDNSRPGYLRMGWSTVGRLPLVVRVAGVSSALRMRASRVPGRALAGRRRPRAPTRGTLLADARVADLLDALGRPRGLRTARTPDYLRWRYGLPALGYRAIALDDDPAARARGVPPAPPGRRGRGRRSPTCSCRTAPRRADASCCAGSPRETGADYAIRIGAPDGSGRDAGFLPFPRQGPLLTWRPLADSSAPPGARRISTSSLGDVELL